MAAESWGSKCFEEKPVGISGHVEISPALLTMHATERAAGEIRSALAGEQYRWFFAIGDLHQAVTAALVHALSGTAGIGALTPESQRLRLDWFEQSRSTENLLEPEIWTARFHVLIERAESPASMSGEPVNSHRLNGTTLSG